MLPQAVPVWCHNPQVVAQKNGSAMQYFLVSVTCFVVRIFTVVYA